VLKLLSSTAERSPEIASLASTQLTLCSRLGRIVTDPDQVSVSSLKLLRSILESGGEGAEQMLLSSGVWTGSVLLSRICANCWGATDIASGLAANLRRAYTQGVQEFLEPLLICLYDYLFPCASRRVDNTEAFRLLQRASAPLAACTDVLCILLNDVDPGVSETASGCLLLLAQTQPGSHAAIIEAAPHMTPILSAGGDLAGQIARALRWAVAQAPEAALQRLRGEAMLLSALEPLASSENGALAAAATDVLRALRA
jgi:hypothetical protein